MACQVYDKDIEGVLCKVFLYIFVNTRWSFGRVCSLGGVDTPAGKYIVNMTQICSSGDCLSRRIVRFLCLWYSVIIIITFSAMSCSYTCRVRVGLLSIVSYPVDNYYACRLSEAVVTSQKVLYIYLGGSPAFRNVTPM